jgi:O-antigen/teichoic acid export membrane protein
VSRPQPPPAATEGTTPSASVDQAPPVAPNLVRSAEIPGAKKVGRNAVETILFRGVSTPLALLLVVVQSRFLEAEGRGAFVLVVLTVTILARLLGQLGVAVVSRTREHDADLRGLVHRALAGVVVLGAAGTVAAIAGARVVGSVDLDVAAIAAAGLVPNLLWQTISGVLLGQARVREWNYVQVLSPLLTLTGMVLLVAVLGGGVRAAVAAWTGAHVLTAAYALYVARDVWLPLGVPPFLDAQGLVLLRLALVMGAVQVVNLITYRIELLLLEHYEGVSAVGVYSIAVQATESLWLIPAAIATASTAPVVHVAEREARRLIRHGAIRGLAITAGAAAAVGGAAPFVIPLLFGDDFSGATRPLAALLPGAVLYAPVTLIVVYLSVRHGRPRLSLAVSVAAMLVTIACAPFSIPAWGTTGAAAASTAGYAAGAALAWLFFARVGRVGARSTVAA